MESSDLPQCHIFGPHQAERTVIYVHGWATNWTSKGLFVDLAEHLAKFRISSILFDLNDYDDLRNATFLALSQQIERLELIVNHFQNINPSTSISLLGHSLGCITTACFLKLQRPDLEKLILLAPAIGEPAKQLEQYLVRRADGQVDEQGRLSFQRKDATITTLGKGYLSELDFDFERLYTEILPIYQDKYQMIVAQDDNKRQTPKQQKVLRDLDARILINANHNFTRQRSELCQILTQFFNA